MLKDNPPTVPEGVSDASVQLVVDRWNHMNFMCRNHILNGLDTQLYEVYSVKKTAMKLWKALDKKYRTEDAGAKKHLAGQFLNYKIVDSRSVVT